MDDLLLRTMLFVPANRERMIAKAPAARADAVVLDLEDAVPHAEKAAARASAREAMSSLAAAGPVFVRVNGVRSGLTRDDLQAVVAPGLAGVVLPKPEEPQDVRDLDVLLREAEMASGVRPGDVTIVPLIESPRGLLRAQEILLASDRIAVTSIGAEDYCAELGVERNVEGTAIAHLRYSVVTLAAAHRMQAIDTPYARIDDLEGLVAEAKFAQAIGFRGKYVLHPGQVEPVNRIFTPSPEEIDRARADVAAFEEAQSRGEGSVALNGRMVDAPIATSARHLLARAEMIAARDSSR